MVAARPSSSSALRRLADKFRHRIQYGSAAALHSTAPTAAAAGRIRPRYSYGAPPHAYRMPPTTTGIDIARFGLLSVATLPFTVWIAYFTYDYVYRVDICREALTKQDAELTTHQSGEAAMMGGGGGLLGRDKELAEVSSLLSQDPSQIIVIAGGNEAGKSKFVSELLRSVGNGKDEEHFQRLSADRGVTYVQLAQLVDSLSSFTHVLVHAFDLRWLRLRHALVDVLPFAGSEILVMKERFSGRDLAAALLVATEALKQNADKNPTKPRPVIVIDGLGEGHGSWMGSSEGQMLAQRLMQWCVYVTKERRLAHVVLTGNEQLVLSLTDQNRITRGHIKVVGLGDLEMADAAEIVKMEISDASDDEIKSITAVFGGFIHDVKGVSRDVQYRLSQEAVQSKEERKLVFQGVIKARFQQQIERVVAAFAQAKESDDPGGKNGANSGADENDDMDPYLDPLKSIYSEAQASQSDGGDSNADADGVGWTQLQLWQTILRIVRSPNQAVSFSELRDEIFDGDKTGLMDLMQEDVLGFQVDRSSDGGWLWKVTPASPALGRAFIHLVNDGDLKNRFELIEMEEEKMQQRREVEAERARLYQERENLDLRKKSLLRTIELGKELGRTELAQQRLAQSFEDIVAEEEHHDKLDRLLRDELHNLSTNRPDGGDTEASDGEMDDKVMLQRQDTMIDQISLQDRLRDAVLGIVSSDETIGKDDEDGRFARLKKAFEVLDVTRDGKIEAADLVRVVKEATGKAVRLKDAEDLISEWDINDDGSLDYQELTRMLLIGQGTRKTGKKGLRQK